MRRLIAGLAAVVLFQATAAGSAHSLLVEASPAAGASVRPPGELLLRFNNRIEPRLSRLRLVDAGGQRRELSPVADTAPDRLRAALPPLDAGEYHVEWQVLSSDGHVVTGRYRFRVAP